MKIPRAPRALDDAAGAAGGTRARNEGGSPLVEAWRARGREITTPDGAIWTIESGPASDATPVVLLHGFPVASWDFAALFDRLARTRRVLTFDFLGYGLSAKPKSHGYSLFEQADVALEVLRAHGVRRAHVVAHDMGTSVATELCARRERGLLPFELATLTLMNGSVHVEMAHLTLGQKILRTPLGPLFTRLNNRTMFHAQMRQVFARTPNELELDAMWELVTRDQGALLLPQLIRYVDERQRFAGRWIGALKRLDVPTLIAWGEQDRVAVFPIARALAAEIPGARLETWPDLGHWPQIESPERVAATIERFLAEV